MHSNGCGAVSKTRAGRQKEIHHKSKGCETYEYKSQDPESPP
jgi:hypothetical protein